MCDHGDSCDWVSSGEDAANPLAPNERDALLPAGTRVSIVLGDSSRSAAGKRVVSGRVVGFAVRESVMDVELCEISTWIYGVGGFLDLEVLPPGDHLVFRVALQETVEATAQILQSSSGQGRSVVAARQVLYRVCWTCRRPAAPEDRFCQGCGRRLSVGTHVGRARVPNPGGCPACWEPKPGDGAYCRTCGHARNLDAQLAQWVGRRAPFQIVHSRRVLGVIEAEVNSLCVRRLFVSDGAQLVADVHAIRFVDRAAFEAFGTEPDPAFSTRLIVRVEDHDYLAAAADMASGRVLRASEPRLPCRTCAVQRGRHEKVGRLFGRHCTWCGTRGRLVEDPLVFGRVGRQGSSLMRHKCGVPFDRSLDRYCSRCGETIANYEPANGRFARLG